jgi:hypothetical protein
MRRQPEAMEARMQQWLPGFEPASLSPTVAPAWQAPRSGPPAPQPGAAEHYDGMIVRTANEYDSTFQQIQ